MTALITQRSNPRKPRARKGFIPNCLRGFGVAGFALLLGLAAGAGTAFAVTLIPALFALRARGKAEQAETSPSANAA